jgi:hypothetical protein
MAQDAQRHAGLSTRFYRAANSIDRPFHSIGNFRDRGFHTYYRTGQLISVSGVDFSIEIAKVRQPVDSQAVFVLFTVDVHFHQMPGKPFTGPLCLRTVCKSAVYAQRAVNG